MNVKTLLAIGALLIALGVALNEWVVLALISPDGEIAPATRRGVWLLDGLLIAGGVAVIAMRRVIAAFEVREGDNTLRNILVAGVVLRVVVYVFLWPHNNDPHKWFINYIIENGALPTSELYVIAFHPPLYYLLATPLALVGPDKLVQLLSVVLSICNLVLLYRFIGTTRLLRDHQARCHAMVLAALMPQFVLFSGFISNDALALPVGTLLFIQAFRYVDRPTRGNLALLAVVEGVGLLTKGTFVLCVPVLVGLVFFVGLRGRLSLARHVGALALFGFLAAGIGSYKFIENTVHFGTPIVGEEELHYGWLHLQEGTYQGIDSLVDVNLPKLIRYPFVGEETLHSIPLLLYGTFWYQYIDESNFEATRGWPLSMVPRAIYALALVPTLLMLLGSLAVLWRNRAPWRVLASPDDVFRVRLREAVLLLMLMVLVTTIIIWGLKHDAWSFFSSRLTFPAFLAIATLLAVGFEVACAWRGTMRRWLNAALLSLYAVFVVYFALEFVYLAVQPQS